MSPRFELFLLVTTTHLLGLLLAHLGLSTTHLLGLLLAHLGLSTTHLLGLLLVALPHLWWLARLLGWLSLALLTLLLAGLVSSSLLFVVLSLPWLSLMLAHGFSLVLWSHVGRDGTIIGLDYRPLVGTTISP
ncbi:hypothetical protein ACYJ1Y_11665 [Natrialbaceae archaeon A-gly3]